MVQRESPVCAALNPQERESTVIVLCVVGKVLSGHARLCLNHAVFPQQSLTHRAHELVGSLAVHHRGSDGVILFHEVHNNFASVSLADALHNHRGSLDQIPHGLLGHCPHRSSDHCLVRDDVQSLARLELSDRHNARIKRRARSRDESLERLDRRRGRDNRICTQVRHRAMRSLPLEKALEEGRTCHNGAPPRGDLARRQVGPNMKPKHRLQLNTRLVKVLPHVQGPSSSFFRGLEAQLDRPCTNPSTPKARASKTGQH
mmetsp:Transcript_14499/g.41295  ORF Transcript_14499/g.41295 Transcript_14499/m.41295 type:complete len:259 (+) Transcript_14499:389-1165(+)